MFRHIVILMVMMHYTLYAWSFDTHMVLAHRALNDLFVRYLLQTKGWDDEESIKEITRAATLLDLKGNESVHDSKLEGETPCGCGTSGFWDVVYPLIYCDANTKCRCDVSNLPNPRWDNSIMGSNWEFTKKRLGALIHIASDAGSLCGNSPAINECNCESEETDASESDIETAQSCDIELATMLFIPIGFLIRAACDDLGDFGMTVFSTSPPNMYPLSIDTRKTWIKEWEEKHKKLARDYCDGVLTTEQAAKKAAEHSYELCVVSIINLFEYHDVFGFNDGNTSKMLSGLSKYSLYKRYIAK